MARYESVEAAATRYFRLVAQLEHPARPQEQGGSVCDSCGRGSMTIEPGRHRKRGRRSRDREVCSACRAPWRPMDLRATPIPPHCAACGSTRRLGNRCASCDQAWRPESQWRRMSIRRQHVRPGVADHADQRAELMDLRPVFERRPRDMTSRDWQQHRLVLAAQVMHGLSVAKIVEQGPGVLPRAPRGWTDASVRSILDRVSLIVEDRLHAARLWGGPWRQRWDSRGGTRSWRRPRQDRSSSGS